MAYRRYVVPIVLFVLAAAMAFGTMMMGSAVSDSAARDPASVTNESISQQVGVWQFVDKALVDSTAGFNESVTVYNSSGVELTKGTDYHWNATDGTISYVNTASVNDNAAGNISYTYFENTQDVQMLSQIIDPIMLFVSNTPLLVGGLALGIILLAAVAILARYVTGSDFESNR